MVVVVVDGRRTTTNDVDANDEECRCRNDQLLEEITVEMGREMQEMKIQCEDSLAERDRLIANLTSQLQDTQLLLSQQAHRLEIVEGRLPMESCRWPAHRGPPRLISGINTY